MNKKILLFGAVQPRYFFRYVITPTGPPSENGAVDIMASVKSLKFSMCISICSHISFGKFLVVSGVNSFNTSGVVS